MRRGFDEDVSETYGERRGVRPLRLAALGTSPFRGGMATEKGRNMAPLKGELSAKQTEGSSAPETRIVCKADKEVIRVENYTGYNSDLTDRAQALRKNMTRQERRLWYHFLRSHEMKFYRQRPIGKYIADFYCSKAKLVIELDGSQHYSPEGMSYDALRTEAINRYGVRVIRFSNADIDQNLSGVCDYINEVLGGRA